MTRLLRAQASLSPHTTPLCTHTDQIPSPKQGSIYPPCCLSDCPPQVSARPVWTCRVVSPGSDCPPDSWSQGPVSPPVPTAALWRHQPPAMLGLLHSSPGQPQSLSAPGRPCPLHLSVLGTKLGAHGGRPNPSWIQEPGGAPSPPPCDAVCEPAPSHGSLVPVKGSGPAGDSATHRKRRGARGHLWGTHTGPPRTRQNGGRAQSPQAWRLEGHVSF